MRRKRLILGLMALVSFFCPVANVGAITEEQTTVIQKHCSAIKVNLRLVQRDDAKVRIRLGAYYDTILTRYILPLNVKLVENSLSNADYIDNQNDFADTKAVFAKDFTKYQQMLEELVAMDCETNPEEFYNALVSVRQKRKTMEQDVLKMRRLISEQLKLVENLKEKL